MIDKFPYATTYAEIETYLISVPLPRKGAQPEQNCVSWTMAAIQKLQEKGLAGRFDIYRFMDDSIAFADQLSPEHAPSIKSRQLYEPANVAYTYLESRASIQCTLERRSISELIMSSIFN